MRALRGLARLEIPEMLVIVVDRQSEQAFHIEHPIRGVPP
jgi:hypothetical protein